MGLFPNTSTVFVINFEPDYLPNPVVLNLTPNFFVAHFNPDKMFCGTPTLYITGQKWGKPIIIH
jgi:hypothetical protein